MRKVETQERSLSVGEAVFLLWDAFVNWGYSPIMRITFILYVGVMAGSLTQAFAYYGMGDLMLFTIWFAVAGLFILRVVAVILRRWDEKNGCDFYVD